MHNYLDAAAESISRLIRFDSSKGKPAHGAPFGQGAADCLAHFLALAKSMGFETNNYEGYAGEVLFGEGEEFAILCHLDVVPAGNGWTHDPFGGEISEGRVWGRGAMDDKGPAVCCLYAMKALKDEGFLPKRTIKLIVGCNEESGWACMDYYKKHANMPEEGFTPDADFPVIYAEKGILHLRMHFPMNDPAPFIRFEGGSAANMVCDRATALPRALDRKRAADCGLTVEGRRLISVGKSAHASTPECGKNAIAPLLRYFRDGAVQRILSALFEDKFGITKMEDETGRLTLSPDIIRFTKGEMQVVCDVRYPATHTLEEVLACIDRIGVKYETLSHQPPLYSGKDSFLVTTLCKVYESCTGKPAQPIAIGGGTYARALKYGVAFGPEMQGDEPVIHQANEYITLERVQFLLDVYKKAIRQLTQSERKA